MTVKKIVANIAATHPAETVAFYRDLLGLELVMDLGWITTVASPVHSGTQISIATEGGSSTPVPDLSIEVEDVEAVFATATKMGLRIDYPLTDEPWGMRRFYVTDPAGKLLNILAHAE